MNEEILNDLKNYLKLYEYCDVEIDEVKLVLFHCLEKELPHIKTLKKHMNRMRVSWNDNVHLVLVLSNISKYQRNLLLKERISFIVPQNQMYVPILGAVINEHIREDHEVQEYLSPSAQRVMYVFLEKEENYQSELSVVLEYSKTSISRALNELSDHGLIYAESTNSMKIWRRSNDLHDTWRILKNVMKSPVKKVIWVKRKKGLFEIPVPYLKEASESYLSRFGMLMPPVYEQKANV